MISMAKKIVEKNILNIIQDALNLKDKRITLQSSVHNVAEWDSLGHLSILSALDKFFKGKVGKIREIAPADSVKKIIRILKDNRLM